MSDNNKEELGMKWNMYAGELLCVGYLRDCVEKRNIRTQDFGSIILNYIDTFDLNCIYIPTHVKISFDNNFSNSIIHRPIRTVTCDFSNSNCKNLQSN